MTSRPVAEEAPEVWIAPAGGLGRVRGGAVAPEIVRFPGAT
ncbi:hypothetical protein ACIBF6_43175 [Streptosporangium amethystogenes]